MSMYFEREGEAFDYRQFSFTILLSKVNEQKILEIFLHKKNKHVARKLASKKTSIDGLEF